LYRLVKTRSTSLQRRTLLERVILFRVPGGPHGNSEENDLQKKDYKEGGSLYLHTEGGEVTLTFNSDEAFKAAVAQAESAPRDGGGSRTPPAVKHVEGAHRAWTFRMVHSFKATPAS
jgi:hypothetical protein